MTSKVKGRVECRKFLHDTAPHYGLRYGPVPATGNFQRLRGRLPLVSLFKVVYAPFFHSGNTASNPVADGSAFEAVYTSSGEASSFESVETPSRLK